MVVLYATQLLLRSAIGAVLPKVECLCTSVVLLAVGIELFDKEDTSADKMKYQPP